MLIRFIIGALLTLAVVAIVYSIPLAVVAVVYNIRLHRHLHVATQQNVRSDGVGISFLAASGISIPPANASWVV
jgi:hypothetical protein